MPELELFDKTEVWIVGARLTDAHLPDIAHAAAAALSMSPDDVVVTDVRDSHFVIDVLVPRVRMEAVLGKEPQLLAALALVPGVELASDAAVHSYGVLGILGTPAEQITEVLQAAETLDAGLRAYVARRCAVVSTGAELGDGRVHDTNHETIRAVLEPAGFEVSFAGVVRDDEQAIAGRVARLVADGFGTVVTTGGVGAESKDRTIEALQLLDPTTATAVLATYEVGHGRHVKPDVRVAVATVHDSLVLALPGPTREAHAGIEAFVEGVRRGEPPAIMVERVARAIRAMWPGGTPRHHPPTPDASPAGPTP